MNAATFPDIRMLVPHDGQMVFLDRVLATGSDSLCAEVAIGPDSVFFDGAGVGSWVGIEYMAQAIAAHAGYGALFGISGLNLNRFHSALSIHSRLVRAVT